MMAINYNLPPDPTNAVLKRIYPWDQYDITLVMSWLYAQAKKTGFYGTFEDFKQRYGAYIEATDPQEIYDLIDNYQGTYHVTPLLSIEQVLKTKNKILNQDIVIDPIPENLVINKKTYQMLRTNDRIMEDDLVVEQIPYHKTSNDAGGYTFTIG